MDFFKSVLYSLKFLYFGCFTCDGSTVPPQEEMVGISWSNIDMKRLFLMQFSFSQYGEPNLTLDLAM